MSPFDLIDDDDEDVPIVTNAERAGCLLRVAAMIGALVWLCRLERRLKKVS